MGMRVEEAGKSECQSLMGWIRVQDLPPRGGIFDRLEREQTSGAVLNHGKRPRRNNCIGVEYDIILWYCRPYRL